MWPHKLLLYIYLLWYKENSRPNPNIIQHPWLNFTNWKIVKSKVFYTTTTHRMMYDSSFDFYFYFTCFSYILNKKSISCLKFLYKFYMGNKLHAHRFKEKWKRRKIKKNFSYFLYLFLLNFKVLWYEISIKIF